MLHAGVLTPHAAAGPEEEFLAMAPGRIATRVARLLVDTTPAGLRALTASPLLDDAAETIAHGPLDGIVYASTSSGYATGFDEEADLVSRLSRRVGLPVLATCASGVRALHALGAERIALVHPPWFDAELDELGASYFRGAGFDVVWSESAALSRDPAGIEPASVHEWTSRHVPDDADAVFIGGTGSGPRERSLRWRPRWSDPSSPRIRCCSGTCSLGRARPSRSPATAGSSLPARRPVRQATAGEPAPWQGPSAGSASA